MVLIIIGFPNLSFTFNLSLSKLLALKEIFLFLYNGFAQYKPLVFTVPIYFPKSNNTLEVFDPGLHVSGSLEVLLPARVCRRRGRGGRQRPGYPVIVRGA